MQVETNFDCIIIGAGVGGMTAAIYLKRYNYNIQLLEKGVPGGQLNQTSLIENYPGFSKIDGASLTAKMLEQLEKNQIQITYGDVVDIQHIGNINIVKTTTATYQAKTIIIATGRQPRKLGIENERELTGHGVSYCAICDGPLFKNKEVCVVGGGNSAFEESLYLSSICKKVTMLHRSEKFAADYELVERIKNSKNIEIRPNSVVHSLKEQNGVLTEVILEDGTEIPCDGIFIYVGQDANVDFLKNLQIDMKGKLIVVDKDMQTSIEGIYACGDSIYKKLYQIITAASEGAIAAASVKRYLK